MDRRAALILAICAAPRVVAMAVFRDPAPTYFDQLATGLMRTGRFGFDGVASTYIEPLYPIFLAGARLVTGDSIRLVLLIQIGVASIGGVLLYRLASRLAGPRIAVYAAAFYACYPYLVRQSVALLEITLCTTLAIAVTLALSKVERVRDAIVCGALLALLLLTRVSYAPVGVIAAIWLAWRGRGQLAAVMALTALLVQAPWLVRNARVDGAPFPSRLGENLYLSTSAYADVLPAHDIDLLVPLALAEIEGQAAYAGVRSAAEGRAADEAMLKRALTFVRDRPARVLWLKARNAVYLFSPQLLPRYAKSPDAVATMEEGRVRLSNERRRPRFEDLAHTGIQSMLLLLAGIGVARRGVRDADAPLLIMLAAGAGVCVVFFPTTRLIAPVMFVVMFYAAAGLDWLLGTRATSATVLLRP
jgi:4-amino-4-deoxy-L-arabinose transferase-like glycosyltransferase